MECSWWGGGVELPEGVCENESVFETLAGAGALMWTACMRDVAEEAVQRVVVGGCMWVVEDGPSSGSDELWDIRVLQA